jgi:hypothetical protein
MRVWALRHCGTAALLEYPDRSIGRSGGSRLFTAGLLWALRQLADGQFTAFEPAFPQPAATSSELIVEGLRAVIDPHALRCTALPIDRPIVARRAAGAQVLVQALHQTVGR